MELATRLVAADPLNEDAHVLLVRAFAATGDEVAVERQLSASLDLFRRELGVEPGPELAEAGAIATSRPSVGVGGGRAALQALLESGEAAVDAGAIEAGIESLRNAAAAAHASGDTEIETVALLSLGSALVHATKEKDEEGAAALHRSIAAAESTGQRAVAASAHRELGYVELLRGDYPRARTWLRTAEELADDDPHEMARIRAITGSCLGDVGEHEQAADAYDESIALSASVGNEKQRAWSLAFLGRTLLLRDELDRAEETLEQACRLSRSERWTAFIACPESLAAEVWVRKGDVGPGRRRRSSTRSRSACQVNDACWEAYGARGLGLLRAGRGDLDGSIELMEDALTRCARQRDIHLWLRAYVLDALCAVATAAGHPTAAAWVTDLGSLAGRSGMRELSVHSYLYRRDLGDPSAIDAARVLAVGIENPHLHELIDPDGPPLLDDLLGKVRS